MGPGYKLAHLCFVLIINGNIKAAQELIALRAKDNRTNNPVQGKLDF